MYRQRLTLYPRVLVHVCTFTTIDHINTDVQQRQQNEI